MGGKGKSKNKQKGKNSSKKVKKKEKKDRKDKEIDDAGRSSRAEDNFSDVGPGQSLTKKEKRREKRKRKKKTNNETSNDHTQSDGTSNESNETSKVTQHQSNTNSENLGATHLSSPKDDANQHVTKDADSTNSGETPDDSDEPGTSQGDQQKDKLKTKEASTGGAESTTKPNSAKSKKTDSVSLPSTPSLEDFLVKPNQTLSQVSKKNISSILSQVPKLEFKSLNQQQVERCMQWIIERSNSNSVRDEQGLYLCAVLGHLAVTTSPDNMVLPESEATTRACGILLGCLVTSFRKRFFISPACNTLLEAIAPVLIESSSSPGWLAFAAHFYPLFGMKDILAMNIASPKYEEDKYTELVHLLLSHQIPNIRDAPPDDQQCYKQFLERILKLAPDEGTLFQLFANKIINRQFFCTPHDRENFFIEFYKDVGLTSSGKSVSISEKLQQLNYLPKSLRGQLSGVLYAYLLEFIKTVETPTSKDLEHFMKLQLSLRLNKDQIHTILMLISTSETACYQELLLKLLKEADIFCHQWQQVQRTTKVQICVTWIKTRMCASEVSEAYQAAEELISCPLVKSIKGLDKMLLDSIREWVIHNVQPEVIFQQLKDIEKFKVAAVREGCLALVKDVIHDCLRIVNEKRLLSQFSKSSFYTQILFYALVKLPIPEQKKFIDSEDVYEKMLPWCEIWTTLLRAQGRFKGDRKFQKGKEIWQNLGTSITSGNVSNSFLKLVERHKNILSFLFANIDADSDLHIQENVKKFLNRIHELVEIEKNARKNISLLESAIKFAQKLPNISGQIALEFNSKRESLSSVKLNELNDEYWKPLLPLLKLASSLQLVMQSFTFRNVAQVCLEENHHSVLNDVEHEMTKLFNFLSTVAVERFEAEWKRVLRDPDSQTVETMKTLLGDPKDPRDGEKLAEEFATLKKYFKPRSLSRKIEDYVGDYMKYQRVLTQVDDLIRLLKTLGIMKPGNTLVTTLTSFAESFMYDDETIVLKDLHAPLFEVDTMISRIMDKIDDVIVELGQSGELVTFLKEIVNEDIRVLIDAVEEHSDQFVSESLVSDLIQIHGFLAPLINNCQGDSVSPDLMLMFLVGMCKKQPNMSMKIRQCRLNVHSLKGLYQNVANREEMTKEIIGNCLNKGVFEVSLDDNGACKIIMSYKKCEGNTSTEKSISELHDLRSRAHLIISSDKKVPQFSQSNQVINYAEFIEQVNILSEIEEAILKLQSSGYMKYQSGCQWPAMTETKYLQELNTNLHEEVDLWEKSLYDARQQHYFLNYFWSDQLCVLYNFLTNLDRTQVDVEDVLTLVHFVDPTIDQQSLQKYGEIHSKNNPKSLQDNPREIVSTIGNALDEIFTSTRPVLREIVDDMIPSFQPLECNTSVQKGELYVVVLDERSPLTVNVMLSLYENTTNGYPEPYQVIFCSQDTTWEEIQLLLRRCFTQTTYLPRESLFCLANVELLANEVQFKLVDCIKKQDSDLDYQLAIICRGGDHHHIVEEFSKFRHLISGMSYPEVGQRLQTTWPDVKCVMSTLPGLGKTEFIRQEVQANCLNVVTFPISGQLDQSQIIQRLKQLDLKHFQCLHFDIGEVDDPLLLDTFLFQLIVTGMVSCGTQLYSLRNNRVYIEISNSLNDRLRDSLVITRCFSCVELQWNDYDDLQVSSKLTSNIQVVCQYLDAFDRNRLERTDIHFFGQQKINPLPATRCRELLRKHYSTDADTTFTALNTFLGTLANQLRKFSKSAFFEIANLKDMLEDKASGVRKNLLEALLDVSKDFAARSLKTCSSSNSQQLPSTASAEHMVQRVAGMIQWEESNHLLIVFHGIDSQTIAAFYRDKDRVPQNVSELLKSQMVNRRINELDDFNAMSHKELHGKLKRIARTKSRKQEMQETVERELSGYALTPDNMLKMILIILRVRANVPIIIMGETGCGKTSLVEYLARTCEIPFSTYNFHAGRTEQEVKEFIKNENDEARKAEDQRWVFLDEINTCHHLGLINEIMCHHTLYGRPLSKKLVLLAACNPYKLRPEENATTAGLEGKNITDEYSKLVYRVHQLPEAMVDYVWDYGSLTPHDEKAYIQRMVQKLPTEHQNVLVDLLAESQKFIRESERNPFCVSLRDVRRCILLVEWFMDMIKKRAEVTKTRKKEEKTRVEKRLEKDRRLAQRYDGKRVIKSIVLALAHCYLSRLQTEEMRKTYRESMTQRFSCVTSEDDFSAIIRMEQEDYLDRMELPPGTARNAALRENVFVMLVSILNRIPVFVVGKPGCSKSLSIQLIRSNLRGKDSKDMFFRTLPQLYVVSYQGSESSTSEGIIKIFEIASKYKHHNKDADVLPVVLLDEVGLAENSPNNPLKVLHSILEPGKGKLPDVAVVGISNWALDAAKMNRAIHLSRPEPTIKDLEETAISLYHGESKAREQIESSTSHDVLNCLANAYHKYQSQQGHANFHGLRDYYSLVKSLQDDSCDDMNQINVALQRNFGGIPKESSKVQEIFIDKLKSHIPTSGRDAMIPVMKLIQENLADPKARHLMLITNGDSAIGILRQNLVQSVKETVTIFGSRFEEDLYDDYNYRMLSRIILCMERDCVLILRDLECIYGSLYDMLNQNYAVVGKRKNCRVALGAYSNPICYVNDGFRCIVLVDYDKVDYSDPPFLNRFEKQLLRFSDVLNEQQQQEIIAELQTWVCQMSSGEELSEQFKESDMFMGFHEDTLPSLVLLHTNDTDEPNEVIVKKCKDDLMWIATPDGVLRTQKCKRLEKDSREVKMLAEEYFEKPIHNGLASFISYVVQDQEFAYSTGGDVGSKTIVMTYATVHTDINKCLNDTTTYQLERLGAYKSEKQLEDKIHHFFSSDKELLILQCKPELDGEHMLLARSIIEDKRKSYERNYRQSNSTKPKKHVCILVHVHRAVEEENTRRWQFNFLSGWKQVFLDALEVPSIPVNEMRTETINNLLSFSIWSFQRFAEKCILWCFNCMKYTQNARKQQSILQITKNLFTSEKVTTTIQKIVLLHVNPISDEESEEAQESWQVKVACDIELLVNSSTLSSAMEYYLSCLIRQPLAKIVYFLERENAWPPHLFSTDDMVSEYEDIWCTILANGSIFSVSDIPECQGAETYYVGGVRLGLTVPFSQVIFRCADAAKNLVMKEYSQAMNNAVNLDNNGELTTEAQLEQLQRYSEILVKLVPCVRQLPESCLSSYMADILEITSAEFNDKIGRQQCISFSTCVFLSFAKQWKPVKDPLQFYAILHLFVWTSRDQLNHLLQLVNWCQNIVGQMNLDALTKKFFVANQDILPFAENESIDERFDVLRTKRKSSGNDSEESDRESSGSDSSDSDFSDSESSDVESSSSDDETDEEEDEEEDEEVEEEQECFEDIFVTVICEKMFPSEKTVTNNGGLESWMQNSTMLLSLSFKVSYQTTAFHFLRLCVDYARFIKPDVVSSSSLYSLYNISKDLKPEYLDADNALQMITQSLIEPVQDQLRGEEEKHAALQNFVAHFFRRCLETNVETKSAHLIIEHVFSLGEEVLIMTPVVYRLLFAEEDKSPGIFFDIIINQSVDESLSSLKDIDEVFKKCYGYAEGSIYHDSYSAVMICDLISSIQIFDEYFNIEDLKSSDSKLLKCFRSAITVVTGGEDNIGLVLLSSVAFLRAFFTMLSKRPSILTSDTPYSHVMGEINSLLAAGGARRSSIQMFFLKQLYGAGMTMFDLRKLCRDSEKLPVIQNQFDQSKITNKVELVSVYGLQEYKEVKDAYWNLNQQNEIDMLNILTKCQNSANHRLALLGMLVNTFYVKKAVGNLSENEERLADWFSFKSKDDLPSPFNELLTRIIGRANFNHRALQISLESSTDEIEIALLILHVSCVVASRVEGKISPLFQYFSNPEKCHGTWILAQGEDRMRKMFDQFASSTNDYTPVTCLCDLRIKYQDDQQQHVCPHCGTETETADCKASSSDHPFESYFHETKSREWEQCTENMDASVFRSLDMIVHACLYAGIATGISSNEAVSPLLRPDQHESTYERTHEDSADYCLNRIKDDLQCLKTILSCKTRTAMDVMHLVVEECTALIQGKILNKDIFSTRQECLKWEIEFTSIAEKLLPKALGSARPLKETRMKFDDENEERPLIENQIQELDEYPSDPEQQDEELKRLFRVTKHPSFTELRSILLNSYHDSQEQPIVLALLLSKFDELPYLACLFPLLKWARLVTSTLTHRISRKEAQSKFINDFIDGHLLHQERSNDERDRLRELFNNFKDAWNKVREIVNQNLWQENEMPYLMESNYIGYCLAEGDLSTHLRTAIKILQSIQNNILDELLVTSIRTRHPALSFLEKNETCCAIMSVSLQEAKEKEIINFDWSDEFLKYVQNPEYGHGEDIDYDFERMETDLAEEIAFGKCHLAESLNKFVFSQELFHSSANVLTKIRESCPQSQSLPEEIRKGLYGLKEHRIQDAQNLIQHIEVAIFVLNTQSTPINQEMTMVEFANKWKSKLPTPFPVDLLPEPKASIKLTHIAVLYEALEDLLADGTIGGLQNQFRAKLTDEAKSSLDGLVDSRNGSLKLQLFLTALRRFVFRYLSAEKFLPEPHEPLRSCLSEPSLWPPDEAPGPDVIPREMTLANIHDIISHLEQEQRGYSSARTQNQRGNQGVTRRKPKRRVIANFSR